MIAVEKEIKTVIALRMEPSEAEVLAADILFLLECTKDIDGMVPEGSVFAAGDCRKRLCTFLDALKEGYK